MVNCMLCVYTTTFLVYVSHKGEEGEEEEEEEGEGCAPPSSAAWQADPETGTRRQVHGL